MVDSGNEFELLGSTSRSLPSDTLIFTMHSQGYRETLSHFQKHPGGASPQVSYTCGFYAQLDPFAQRYNIPFMQRTHVGRNCGMLIMSSSRSRWCDTMVSSSSPFAEHPSSMTKVGGEGWDCGFRNSVWFTCFGLLFCDGDL
ncbi:uncharacterized protein ARMOST_12321 [Armillaria ostoyae]|uniref:Uncharacterized protein n=1 Tax=Armillaria ostoyae TaxID=47428 RepID=A0A284RJK5_ARMOS|nr:uncharacterized protein ARMOST_12321 [Armillaria ostoyae]